MSTFPTGVQANGQTAPAANFTSAPLTEAISARNYTISVKNLLAMGIAPFDDGSYSGFFPPGVTLLYPYLPPGEVGTAYNFKLQAMGGVPPYTWSPVGSTGDIGSGSFPPTGLSLAADGTITGTPTQAMYVIPSHVIIVTDSQGNTNGMYFYIDILPSGKVITEYTIPDATLGQAYSENIGEFTTNCPNGIRIIHNSEIPFYDDSDYDNRLSTTLGLNIQAVTGNPGHYIITICTSESVNNPSGVVSGAPGSYTLFIPDIPAAYNFNIKETS